MPDARKLPLFAEDVDELPPPRPERAGLQGKLQRRSAIERSCPGSDIRIVSAKLKGTSEPRHEPDRPISRGLMQKSARGVRGANDAGFRSDSLTRAKLPKLETLSTISLDEFEKRNSCASCAAIYAFHR